MGHIRTVKLTTRKEHACEWCGEPIKTAELAQYHVYSDDELGILDYYMHPECWGACHVALREGRLYDDMIQSHAYKRGLPEKKEE